MDVWMTLLPVLGPALGKAIYEVGKEVVVKPLTGPLAEQVEAWVRRGYDAKVDDARVRGVVEVAVKATGLTKWEDWDDYPLRAALDRLAGEGQGALRKQTVAAALAMTRKAPEEVPDALLAALRVGDRELSDLTHFLWAFRGALARADEEYRALVELAHQDAVRGYLRALALTVVPTREGPAQRRVVVVKPEVPAGELRALWGEYMTYLVNSYHRLDFRGIVQIRNPVELSLAEVYVSLNVVPSGGGRVGEPCEVMDEAALRERKRAARAERLGLKDELRDQQQMAALRERAERSGIKDVLRKQPRLVVLGDPGAGKTTFLRYVALALAEGEQAARERLGFAEHWLPIYLPLAAYSEALRRQRVLAGGLRVALLEHAQFRPAGDVPVGHPGAGYGTGAAPAGRAG